MIYVFEDGAVVYDGSTISEEEKQKAVAVEKLPEPEQVEGKIAVLRASKAENRVYYEYIDKPENPLENEVEQLKLKINELETALLEMTTISAEQEQAILELSMLLAGGN